MNIRINVSPSLDAPRLPPSTSLAYAAGMFDGDGCIHIAKQKKLTAKRGHIFRLVASVAQNHLGTLIDFQGLVGVGGRVYQQTRKGSQNKDTYSLVYDGQGAAEVIRRLRPYLHRKLDEANVALMFQDDCEIHRHFGPKGCPESIWKQREAHYRKLRNLK